MPSMTERGCGSQQRYRVFFLGHSKGESLINSEITLLSTHSSTVLCHAQISVRSKTMNNNESVHYDSLPLNEDADLTPTMNLALHSYG